MGTRDVLREGAEVWIAKEDAEDFSGNIIKMMGEADARTRLDVAGRE